MLSGSNISSGRAVLSMLVGIGLVSIFMGGCAAKRVDLGDTGAWTNEIVVRSLAYDKSGLPIVPGLLAKRPSGPGDRFTVVRLLDNKPVVSYDIAVKRQKPDFAKPFRTIYKWTGKGFREGALVTGALGVVALDASPNTNDQALLELAIVATPITVGTMGGFVIGLADGIKQIALEASKVVVNGEEAVTCTTYEYDHLGRLLFMRMYTPDRSRELVRTEYRYGDFGPVPVRTVVRSLVEGTEREVLPSGTTGKK